MPVNGNENNITITKQSNTVLTLFTENKFVDKNLQFSIDVQEADTTLNIEADSTIVDSVPTKSGTNIADIIGQKENVEPDDGYYIEVRPSANPTVSMKTAGWIENDSIHTIVSYAPTFYPVSEASIDTLGDGVVTPLASVSGVNAVLSNVDNGIQISATGGGYAEATFSSSVSAAGYVPIGTTNTDISIGQRVTSASAFISEVSMTTPSSGNRTFSVTVPNGNSNVTFMFSVDSEGNVTIE